MSINKVFKILGFIFLPLLPLTVAVYFLFPYINEEKYQEVAEKYDEEIVLADNFETPENYDGEAVEEDLGTLRERASAFQETIQELQIRLDSLTMVNDSLESKLLAKEEELTDLKENEESATEDTVSEELSNEELAENVKSLLDLDDENLSPILNEMSDSQLIRLYEVGSSLQRKKLLRALESKRAAKLMTEVM